jgi:hypothetical protein
MVRPDCSYWLVFVVITEKVAVSVAAEGALGYGAAALGVGVQEEEEDMMALLEVVKSIFGQGRRLSNRPRVRIVEEGD